MKEIHHENKISNKSESRSILRSVINLDCLIMYKKICLPLWTLHTQSWINDFKTTVEKPKKSMICVFADISWMGIDMKIFIILKASFIFVVINYWDMGSVPARHHLCLVKEVCITKEVVAFSKNILNIKFCPKQWNKLRSWTDPASCQCSSLFVYPLIISKH